MGAGAPYYFAMMYLLRRGERAWGMEIAAFCTSVSVGVVCWATIIHGANSTLAGSGIAYGWAVPVVFLFCVLFHMAIGHTGKDNAAVKTTGMLLIMAGCFMFTAVAE